MVRLACCDKVLALIREGDLFRPGARILVAVSGGPDSIALLHLLYQLRHEMGLSLIVAHYNHALRKGADRDQRFVREIAERWGLPFVTEKNRASVPKSGSIEEFARDKRYAFFRKMARVKKADCVSVAHTMDDLAETVLMRILRGTGMAGLRAMFPKREINGVVVVRPLLILTRAEIEAYIRKNRLKIVRDPTNDSLDFFRNRIRNKIMPFLEKEAGRGVRSRLAGLASIAASDYDLIDNEVRKAYGSIARRTRGGVFFSLSKFASLHCALRRSLVRMAVEDIKGDLNAFDQEHILSIEQLSLHGKVGMGLDLPKGIKAKRSARHLALTQSKKHQTLERN
jgi:tRNA(Ile)-lysidine synthase